MYTDSQALNIFLQAAFPNGIIVCPNCSNPVDDKRDASGYFSCNVCRSKYRNGEKIQFRFNEFTHTELKGSKLKPAQILELILGFWRNESPEEIRELATTGKNSTYRFLHSFMDIILKTYPEDEYEQIIQANCLVYGVQNIGNLISIKPLPELAPKAAHKIVEDYKLDIEEEYQDYSAFIVGKDSYLWSFIKMKKIKTFDEPNLKSHKAIFKGGEEFFQFYQDFQENRLFTFMRMKHLAKRIKLAEYFYNYRKSNPEASENQVLSHFIQLIFSR